MPAVDNPATERCREKRILGGKRYKYRSDARLHVHALLNLAGIQATGVTQKHMHATIARTPLFVGPWILED
jgi:hypothetical protein